ncbi:MAG: exodeoxyribonuclease III [Candidatus Muirbacterium halophilum]|nr:exodeoxyribonuclease III [Candidatus Muirbacterium halophilum]MCK9475340.1 exodeoxyribonuclease III [Candidatus Muirbacterium halophilum]
MKILSWNVNGIRAVHRKGLFSTFDADILCIQETKAHKEQLSDDIVNIPEYYSYFAQPERKGYSGVAVFSKIKPLSVEKGWDNEGRSLILEYNDFYLLNTYFPNGKASKERLQYKLDFYDKYLSFVKKLKKPVIICGDVNTAHKEIDLARPAENRNSSGFLPVECAWIDKLLDSGFKDSFRLFNKEGDNYSWWDMKTRARDRNVGWRIDYFFVDNSIAKKLKDAFILKDILGSDHAPIGIEF